MSKTLEQYSMMMVTYSGMAKSSALEAIDLAEEGKDYLPKFEEAEENLKLAGQEHFELLSKSATEEIKIDILLMHAEDQMLNAETTLALAKKMVKIYERLK